MQYNSNPLRSMTITAVTTAMLQSLEWIYASSHSCSCYIL